MYSIKRVTGLLSLTLIAILLLRIATAATVLAFGGNVKSTFAMKDNPTFTPDIAPIGTEEAHGSGKFRLDGEDLNNLKFRYQVKAFDLMPDTWYQASITVRDLTDPNTDGPDDTVVVGWAQTNAIGRLNFAGTAVLPDPTGTSPQGIVSGWRIDQQIRLPGAGTLLNGCVDCVLVCSPTTKVQLNPSGDGLIPGTP